MSLKVVVKLDFGKCMLIIIIFVCVCVWGRSPFARAQIGHFRSCDQELHAEEEARAVG